MQWITDSLDWLYSILPSDDSGWLLTILIMFLSGMLGFYMRLAQIYKRMIRSYLKNDLWTIQVHLLKSQLDHLDNAVHTLNESVSKLTKHTDLPCLTLQSLESSHAQDNSIRDGDELS